MTLREILQSRDAGKDELRGILTAHPDGNLPDEQRARADALEAEIGRLNDQERRQVLLDELDRRAAGTPVSGTGDANFDKLASAVSFFDVVNAQLGSTDARAGRAREVSQEIERRSGRKAEGLFYSMEHAPVMERRVQTTNTNASGGWLVAEELRPVIDRLRERLIVRRAGATILSGLTGDLVIPRLTASNTAYWIGDNQAVTPGGMSFDSIGLNMRTVGAMMEISRGMLLQSSQDVVNLGTNDLTQILQVALDTAAIAGTGASSQPTGLLNRDYLTFQYVAGGNGGAPSWNAIIAAIAALDVANVDGSIAFVTNPKFVAKARTVLRTTADTASTFLMSDPNSLAGYPLFSSTIVPSNLVRGSSGAVCSPLIAADFSQLLLAFWGGVDTLVNPYASGSYEKGNVQVRCLLSCDLNVRHPEAFVVMPDFTTT